MYSINQKRDFIFIHLPKTGGGSIKNHLLRSIDNDCLKYPEITNGLSHSKYHGLYTDYKQFLGDEEYERRYRFAVIRNPWDRVVSLYHWRRHGTPAEVYEKTLASGKIAKRLDLGIVPRQRPGENGQFNISFEEFIYQFKTRAQPLEQLSQWKFFDPDTYVITYENLQEEFDGICDDLQIEKGILSNIHATKHEHYSTYYTSELRQIVADWFINDIRIFGYEFEQV